MTTETRAVADRREDERARYRAGARAGLVLTIPTLALGITFGLLARSLGWGIVAPIAFSGLAFSGSAQFAVASVLGAGGTVVAALVAAVLVNARFAAMGVAVAPALRGGRLRRALEAQAVVDASWVLANRGEGRFDREFMIGATLPQFVAWVAGTAIGAIGGAAIGSAEDLGLDAIFPAFFLTLLAGELRSAPAVAAAVVAGVTALVLIPVTPPGIPVVAACAAALLGLRRG
jgi:4-azaleucine resistance transporter AzlC